MSAGDPGRGLLPGLPRDDDGPVFTEPWQAQAFAMAVRLHELGHFTWPDWAVELSRQISSAGPDSSREYYEHWLNALEVMVAESGLSTERELTDRREHWRAAAAATPHGQPIELSKVLPPR